MMRRFTEVKKRWQPTAVQSSPGIFTLDPAALLEDEAKRLTGFWGAPLDPPKAWIPIRGSLSELLQRPPAPQRRVSAD
eukprot:7386416-Pyramimonas_sp.AAC.1